MLKPLPDPQQETISTVVLRQCEKCKTMVDSSFAINIMMTIGSPGHPDLPPFQCPLSEHWACSIDCMMDVAKACVEEHMIPLLRLMHVNLETSLASRSKDNEQQQS